MNLVECRRCGKRMIDEEFDTHKCTVNGEGKESKTIEILWYSVTEDNAGIETVLAKGRDGALYILPLLKEGIQNKIRLDPTNLDTKKYQSESGQNPKTLISSKYNICHVAI